MTVSAPNPNRSFWIDALKGLACMTIVWHHLAFYGPMSDVAAQVAPGLIAWLSEYGRIAVQVFLVMGGYLAAASLAPQGLARAGGSLERIGRRAMRLMAPYSVALLLAVLVAALVRPWFDHDSVPGQPSWHQLIANVLMLQDVTHEEALSAGVWYVAIDFQLFAAVVLLLAAVRRWAPAAQSWAGLQGLTLAQGLVILATALSLLYFNLHSEWDMWFFYFMGSYGLGMLAYWGQHSTRPWAWSALLLALGLAALELQFRLRIAVALAAAVGLLWAMRAEGAGAAGQAGGMRWRQWRPVRGLLALGQMSYSVFLVHFSVILLANAAMSHWLPTQPWWNWLGMLATCAVSIAVGNLLYRVVESHTPNWRYLLRLGLGFVSTGLVVSMVSSRL